MAVGRSEEGTFTPVEFGELFTDVSLPNPRRPSDTLRTLENRGLVLKGKQRGSWKLTAIGRARANDLLSDVDMVALAAENASGSPTLGSARLSVISPALAPISIITELQRFLAEHPFERNVFGMTRFPDDEDGNDIDPVQPAIEAARDACKAHGLEFHLASDRAMNDDLWTNVAAHMWASHYGIAFFEDRRSRGVNYNLTIEVGSMLMAGRRCALLKDRTISALPTDLVGRIYKSVDLDLPQTVSTALHSWARDDLSLGPCAQCP
jgi:hypothetical protein